MARETELTCPSGLRVRMRGIKGKDLDGLRDKRRVASGEAISDLLDACTIEVLDRAIYDRLPSFAWADALVGDRTRAIVSLRETTSGGEYDFRLRCRDKECRQMIDWTLNLGDLPIKPLSRESAETFLAGNVYETTLNDTLVKFCLNTGRTQARILKLAAQHDSKVQKSSSEGRMMLGLAGKIISVGGVDNVMAWLGELDLLDIRQLVEAMDAVDCGVETAIEIVCDECGLKQEVELPLDSTFFQRPI